MTREENLVSAIQAVVVGAHSLRLMVCAPHQQPCTATQPPGDRDLATEAYSSSWRHLVVVPHGGWGRPCETRLLPRPADLISPTPEFQNFLSTSKSFS